MSSGMHKDPEFGSKDPEFPSLAPCRAQQVQTEGWHCVRHHFIHVLGHGERLCQNWGQAGIRNVRTDRGFT